MSTNTNMSSYFSRVRGTLDVPYRSVLTEGELTFVGPAGPSTTHQKFLSSAWYREICDIKAKWGIGVWPYRPVADVKIKQTTNATPQARCQPCFWATQNSQPSWGCYGVRRPVLSVPVLELSECYENYSLPIEFRKGLTERMDAKLPSISQGVPMVFVFLVELRDIKSLFETFKAKYASILHRIAAGHLTWSFAIRPFLSDLNKMRKTLLDWRERVQGVRDGIGKVHDLNVAMFDEIGPEHTKTPWYFCSEHCENCLNRSGYPDPRNNTFDKRTRIKASLKVKYRYSWPDELDVMSNSVLGFLAASNLLPKWEDIWELIPFSFVGDWIFNFDKLFEVLHLDRLGSLDVVVDIVDICLSVKLVDAKVWYQYDDKRGPHYITEDRTTFYRYVGEEAITRLDWNVKLPTLSQLLLGGSLVEVLRHGRTAL